ncbi:hypothetical protein AG1IA_04206 [Rhizoctonia solani AG-1 IA]|uniref:Uncharacterized protein n=1 Tax=Thanatephorus cucumeris (strain AG1-IA) TaxID=983506 RepID=L8WYG0_THACA|nr:hypothetical protein AG1IA_04206 [Rhizoctonia solani AG-1 IA]
MMTIEPHWKNSRIRTWFFSLSDHIMPGGPVAAQLDEQPLIVEHDTREDGNQPVLPGDGTSTPVSKPERTPLPWKPLIVLTALNAVCPLAFELVYPFVNSMIVEIGVTDDPERVGFYSGLIVGGPFSKMTQLIIYFVGIGIFGHEPHYDVQPQHFCSKTLQLTNICYAGLGGLSISIMSFGLSKSLAGMIMSRCIGGALGARPKQPRYRILDDERILSARPNHRFTTWRSARASRATMESIPNTVLERVPVSSSVFGRGGFLPDLGTLPSKVKSRRKAKRSPYSSGSSTLPTKQTTPLLVNETELETNRASKKPTWRTVMTPSILSLVINNACMRAGDVRRPNRDTDVDSSSRAYTHDGRLFQSQSCAGHGPIVQSNHGVLVSRRSRIPVPPLGGELDRNQEHRIQYCAVHLLLSLECLRLRVGVHGHDGQRCVSIGGSTQLNQRYVSL